MTTETRLEKITDCLQKLTIETKLQHERTKDNNENIESLTESVSTLTKTLQGNGGLGLVSKVVVMWKVGVWGLAAAGTTGLGLIIREFFL